VKNGVRREIQVLDGAVQIATFAEDLMVVPWLVDSSSPSNRPNRNSADWARPLQFVTRISLASRCKNRHVDAGCIHGANTIVIYIA
jgi:hypothetical protein